MSQSPGGQDDTMLSGSFAALSALAELTRMSSTDPGSSQSIMHRPSSTLAANMVDCDHTSINDTEYDSFLDPENKYEFGEATLRETAALAEANALSAENRKVNKSPPLACSNPGQSAYPKFTGTPAAKVTITPAGSSSAVKLVQKTLFGGVVIPETGVKSPKSIGLRNKVNKNIKVTKENTERLQQQIAIKEKRKADNMASASTKLSPPDKLATKTEIVREYDEEAVKQQQPDVPKSPAPDKTGHINLVQAVTPVGKVNSEENKEENNK